MIPQIIRVYHDDLQPRNIRKSFINFICFSFSLFLEQLIFSHNVYQAFSLNKIRTRSENFNE
jgi:hypothetical protein